MLQADSTKRWLSRFVLFLAVSAVYLYAYPSPTVTYAVVDLLHVAAGVVLTLLLLIFLIPQLRAQSNLFRLGFVFLFFGAILGVALIKVGTPLRLKVWLLAHIALCVLGTFLLAASWLHSRGWLGASAASIGLRFAALALLTAAIAAGSWWTREVGWRNARANHIVNPLMPPDSMDHEGDGAQGKFFPSSAQTKHGGNIPSQYS